MPTIAIVLIAVLAVHYFMAILTIYLLLRDKSVVKAIIPWNLVILLVPIVGPSTYLIYRCLDKKK